jgi:hypothetical protein
MPDVKLGLYQAFCGIIVRRDYKVLLYQLTIESLIALSKRFPGCETLRNSSFPA